MMDDGCYQHFIPTCQFSDYCCVPIFYSSSSEHCANCCIPVLENAECIATECEKDVSLCKTGNEQTKVSVANYASGCINSDERKTRKGARGKESKTRKGTVSAGEKKPRSDSKIESRRSSENNAAKNADENLQNAAESNEKNNGESSEIHTAKPVKPVKKEEEFNVEDFIKRNNGHEILMVNLYYPDCEDECGLIKGPTILIGSKQEGEQSRMPGYEKFCCKLDKLEHLQRVDMQLNVYRTWYKGNCHEIPTYHCENSWNNTAANWQSKCEDVRLFGECHFAGSGVRYANHVR